MRQPDREAAQLARQQHQLATCRQLLDMGFTRKGIDHRVESGMFEKLESGVYVVGASTNSFEQGVMAAVLRNPGAVASHRTAAHLHGLIERPPTFSRCRSRTAGIAKIRRGASCTRHKGSWRPTSEAADRYRRRPSFERLLIALRYFVATRMRTSSTYRS